VPGKKEMYNISLQNVFFIFQLQVFEFFQLKVSEFSDTGSGLDPDSAKKAGKGCTSVPGTSGHRYTA
jgi:hypothetical protein